MTRRPPAITLAVGQVWRAPDGHKREVLSLSPSTLEVTVRGPEWRGGGGRQKRDELRDTVILQVGLRLWIRNTGAELVPPE